MNLITPEQLFQYWQHTCQQLAPAHHMPGQYSTISIAQQAYWSFYARCVNYHFQKMIHDLLEKTADEIGLGSHLWGDYRAA